MLSTEDIARVCHEANRALQVVLADPTIPVSDGWAALTRDAQLVSVEGVEHALAGASPRELHESWMRAKIRDGWRHGPIKDEGAREHPSLLPYDELPAAQQAKDDVFHAIVGALGDPPTRPLNVAGRHPSVVAIARFFESDHLPENLATVANAARILAAFMVDNLPDSPELTAGLRRLLEAKDCFVRAAL